MTAPDWDLLIAANDEDSMSHSWFPAGKTKLVTDFRALEGLRFRNCYLTSMAIEKGSATLFEILYRSAKCTRPMGLLLHTSDYREYE
jgi:hypothetical protein